MPFPCWMYLDRIPRWTFTSPLRFSLALLVASLLLTGWASRLLAQQCSSQAVEVGYRDFGFGGGLGARVTAEKPESKLWWNDGFWWGTLWDPSADEYRIHRLSLTDQCWVSVGPGIDDRASSRADALWDGQKLFIVSHASGGGRLYRYSYNPTSDSYTADAGFPVAVNDTDSETLVLTKDSTGQLWVTWTKSGDVMINRSLADHQSWGTPFMLPADGASASGDDVSAVVPFESDKIGLMWSNQSDKKIYFAVHQDQKSDLEWEATEIALGEFQAGAVADDHINLSVTCNHDGSKVVAASKTSLSGDDPGIYLMVRGIDGSWTQSVVARDSDDFTRPIVLCEANSDKVHVLLRSKKNGGSRIYRKSSNLTNPQFEVGLGEFFIDSNSDDDVNDITSTKQTVSAESGLLALASDDGSKRYLHNYLEIIDEAPSTAPRITAFSPASGVAGTVVQLTGQNFIGASEVSFGGVPDGGFNVISASVTETTVPTNAGTGRIKVTNQDGFGESLSDFVVIEAPQIASFSPDIGPIGTEVTVLGTGFSGLTSVSFGGIAANMLFVDSDTQLRAEAPAGASTGVITVTNAAGAATSTSEFTVTAGTALSFGPTDDAHVRSNRAGNNYGDNEDLQVEEDTAQRRTYLKFVVSGLAGTVQSAKLRLLVTDPGNDGGGIYPVSNDYTTGGPWKEGALIWDNAPPISGSPLSTTGSVSVGDIVEFDLTGAISGNGTYSFGIKNASTSRMEYSSKEGSQAPVLEIDLLTSPVPVVSSFIPASGVVGAEVTISGLNFSSTTSVKFGAADASFSLVSDTELLAIVPSAASTAKIFVTNPDGSGESGSVFTVISAPIIESFSPSEGPEGSEVTILGQQLAGVSAVSFNGAPCVFTSISDTELRGTVPSGASTGLIKVVNAAGESSSGSAFSVTRIPVVSSFSPNGGPAGTLVTINGNNFSGTTNVAFGTIAAVFTFVSDSEVTATTPVTAITGPIKVTNADGNGESAANFMVISLPAITSFAPASGPPGTEVTLSGSGFGAATAVSFAGTVADTYTPDSDSQLRASVPVGASSGKISVANAAGTTESAGDFQVAAAPSTIMFTTVADAHVKSSRADKNYGDYLDLRIEEDTTQRRAYMKFLVSGLAGAVQSAKIRLLVTDAGIDGGEIYSVSNDYSSGGAWTDDGLTWNNAPSISGTPLSSVGAVSDGLVVEFDVTAAISGNGSFSFAIKRSADDRMEYSSKEGPQAPVLEVEVLTSPLPVISSFNPTSGIAGTEVTITGLNLGSTEAVAFNGTPAASFSILSNTQVLAVAPTGVNSGKISITNADGTGESVSSFTVILPSSLVSFSPASGPTGSQVTLAGQNLEAVTALSFGSTAASEFIVDSQFQIRVTVPAGASNSKISATSAAGTAETAGVFTVTLPPAPVISSFSPGAGPVGAEVTIIGQNFTGVTAVSFGSQAASYEFDSSTQIRATVPSAATTGKISITNSGGVAESSGDFEVTAPPSTITLTPLHDSFGKSSSPDKNYGDDSELRVKFSTLREYHTYLKFQVTGLVGPVQSAKLRMLVESSSDDGGSIYLVSNNYAGTTTPWEESGLTWNNGPALTGNVLSSLGVIKSGTMVEFDVSPAINGNGTYSFGIKNGSSDSGRYSSKEGPTAPVLIIEASASPSSSP